MEAKCKCGHGASDHFDGAWYCEECECESFEDVHPPAADDPAKARLTKLVSGLQEEVERLRGGDGWPEPTTADREFADRLEALIEGSKA